MQMSEIRNDVVVPEFRKYLFRSRTTGTPVGQLRFLIDSLDVGQSFSVTALDGEDMTKIRDRISSSRTQVMKKKKCKFMLRKTGDRAYTIWRTE